MSYVINSEVNSKAISSVDPAAAQSAGDVTGATLDKQAGTNGIYTEAQVIVQTGDVTGSPSAQSVTVKVQHKQNSGDSWVDITDTQIVTAATIVMDKQQVKVMGIDLKATKRYVQVIYTVAFTSGTSPKIYLGAIMQLLRPRTV